MEVTGVEDEQLLIKVNHNDLNDILDAFSWHIENLTTYGSNDSQKIVQRNRMVESKKLILDNYI